MTARFQFFSRSADRKPGQGAGEYVRNTIDYSNLECIPDWRRELSNFSDSCPLVYDGLTFRTVEHCFQYAKCSTADRTAAAQFSLESGSRLARGGGADARSNRKLVVLTTAQIEQWALEKAAFLRVMWTQKVDRSPLFREVLVRTRGAELWHIAGRGSTCERWTDLEHIRDDIVCRPDA